MQAERDTVNRSEAEAAFEDDDFSRAASLWGRMRSSEPSFEDDKAQVQATQQKVQASCPYRPDHPPWKMRPVLQLNRGNGLSKFHAGTMRVSWDAWVF